MVNLSISNNNFLKKKIEEDFLTLNHLHCLWNMCYGPLAAHYCLLLCVLNVKISTSSRIEREQGKPV